MPTCLITSAIFIHKLFYFIHCPFRHRDALYTMGNCLMRSLTQIANKSLVLHTNITKPNPRLGPCVAICTVHVALKLSKLL